MKKSIICMVTAATLFSGVQSAQAGDKEKYLLGGLLGGWILNEVVGSSSVEFRSRQPVVVERRHHHHRCSSSCYEYRRIRTWVPGYHKRSVNRCGRVEYRWIDGHYNVRRERVQVCHGRRQSRSYGYNRCR